MRLKMIAAAIALAALLSSLEGRADPVGVCVDPRGCGGGGGGGGGQREFAPREVYQPSPEELAREQRRREALAANNRGVAFHHDGEWAKAVAAYQEAVDKDPGDQVMRDNLARAQAGLANLQGLEAHKRGDFAAALALFQDAANKDPKTEIFRQNLTETQAALANAQAQLESQRRDEAAAEHMQKAIQGFAQTLNAAPVAGGLDFDGNNSGTPPDAGGNGGGLDFTSVIAANSPAAPVSPPSSGDPNMVDARNVSSGLSKPVENAIAGAYANAPPGVSDRVRKGFQAVATSDWKVAKAWFEDALSRDPGNADLKRLIATIDQPPKGVEQAAGHSHAAAPAIHDLASLNANASKMSTGQIMDSLGEIIAEHLVESAVSGN